MILRPLVIAGAWAVLLTTAGSVAWAADEKADAGGVIAVQAERGHDVARIWPIDQDAVLLDHGAENPAAVAFYEYLYSPAARAHIRERGYALPED